MLHRMTGLLSKSKEGKRPANFRGGGWSMRDVNDLLHHHTPLYKDNRSNSEEAEDSMIPNAVQTFDVVAFCVMHGWMHR